MAQRFCAFQYFADTIIGTLEMRTGDAAIGRSFQGNGDFLTLDVLDVACFSALSIPHRAFRYQADQYFFHESPRGIENAFLPM